MKELTYKNQHEIGFDIGCLHPSTRYIAKDMGGHKSEGRWYEFPNIPCVYGNGWLIKNNKWAFKVIPVENEPKKFTGDWEDSLFFIDRSEIANYNGTAI